MEAVSECRSWREMVRYWQNDGTGINRFESRAQLALEGEDMQSHLTEGPGMGV